jgi:FkbM family methyltransferase
MRSVEGRWGTVWYYGKDEYVGRSLHNYGEYNPDETEKIIDLARMGGGLNLDIGANFGVMAQAIIASGMDCLAFEPQPDVYDVLVKNIPFEKCYNRGLGSVTGTLQMPKILRGSKCNYGGQGIGFKSELGTIDVYVDTLDSFKFDNIGFIKIDVEGFEEQVLMGGRETILQCKPIMYIEDDRREKSASLRKYIEGLGYTIEEHRPSLYREMNFFRKPINVWAPYNYVSHNLICKPIKC